GARHYSLWVFVKEEYHGLGAVTSSVYTVLTIQVESELTDTEDFMTYDTDLTRNCFTTPLSNQHYGF
ncbi:MAG: hypothetical protein SV253_09525, partial [Halobacteria archaeon]|nr:hypothetical protein [Halobacteria archaeon]